MEFVIQTGAGVSLPLPRTELDRQAMAAAQDLLSPTFEGGATMRDYTEVVVRPIDAALKLWLGDEYVSSEVNTHILSVALYLGRAVIEVGYEEGNARKGGKSGPSGQGIVSIMNGETDAHIILVRGMSAGEQNRAERIERANRDDIEAVAAAGQFLVAGELVVVSAR